MKNDLEVLVVGGGLSGMSTAYHLEKKGIGTIVVEAGRIGWGSDDMISGTAGPLKPAFSKMITTPYESDFGDVCKRHSKRGAKTYLELTHAGRDLQKSLAKEVNSDVMRELGSLVVGKGQQLNDLKEEHENYKKMGFGNDFRHYSKEKIAGIYNSKQDAFDGGIFVPRDAIIDQDRYLIGLQNKAKISAMEYTKVTDIKETPDKIIVKTNKGEEVTADNVVIATNGFYKDKNLDGLLDKSWSFIISYQDKGYNTPNTWDFAEDYHYWTRQDDILMVGGEDRKAKYGNTRFSVDEEDAVRSLVRWANEKFPHTKGKTPVSVHYGILASTPDELPIVGKFSKGSRIAYVVGCNGMGQSTLSYGASLIPSILGYEKMAKEQEKFADFLSPQRATLK